MDARSNSPQGGRSATIQYSQQYLLQHMRPSTPRSYGERHERWAAPSLPIDGERSGYVITTRQEMSGLCSPCTV